jgi:serine protease AprX
MAQKRIIAHYMHEAEKAVAADRMSEFDETPGYLVGNIDEDAIPDLVSHGLIIQVLEEPSAPQTSRGLEGTRGMSRSAGWEPSVGPEMDGAETPAFYLLGVNGPLLASWRERLAELDVEILEYIPQDYLVRLVPLKASEVEDQPFVTSLRPYSSSREEVTFETRSIQPPFPGARPMLTFDVLLHRDEDLEKVTLWLQERDVRIAGASGRKIRVCLWEDSPIFHQVTSLPEVATAEPYVPPQTHNDVARVLLRIDQAGNAPQSILPQTGEGQIVAVADTGLDDQHPDFQSRINRLIARGRHGDHSDPDGHGTHVAGSILGDGSDSGGQFRGTAPNARLVLQSILDSDDNLVEPVDLGDLFEEAYSEGARIHNNSWGSPTVSAYAARSAEVDEFVASHRDMLIVISAGNYGTATQCNNSQPGCVDWLSIGSPATSKNALTVGASRSDRTSGGYSVRTYHEAWPNCFPAPPIADAKVSGDPECLAATSSRGPCDDHRIKPDVVAPGTDILSTRSSQASQDKFWGIDPAYPRYAFLGGTSMAASLVTGCAALVREYYVKERQVCPSAALLKATLINGTRWLTGEDSVADHDKQPNFHQGFGCVDMRTTIPNSADPGRSLDFVDTWQEPTGKFTQSGERFNYRVTISGGQPLRICLVWTDVPGRALQNNLNLFLQHLPSSRKWTGNENLPLGLRGIPDPENNVEVIRLESPPPGPYLIQITATNLLRASQDFALVASGKLPGGLVPIV